MGLIKPVMLKPETLMNVEEGYILTYPCRDPDTLKSRVKTLKKLGVDLIEFTGPKEVSGLNILGKGTRSIVLKVWVSGCKYALKVRRPDSHLTNLRMEAENMKIANRVAVGPKLIDCEDDMILMELIYGKPIPEWVQTLKDRDMLRRVLLRLITDTYKLDMAGLNHGELSRASKHIYIKPDGEPVILDFGSSSIRRKPSNVTALVQYMFIGGSIAGHIQKLHGYIDRGELLQRLKTYKEKPSENTISKLIEALKLQYTLPL